MTELLERRIMEVFASVAEGIVTLSDAQFLVQMIRSQSVNMNNLADQILKLEEENAALAAQNGRMRAAAKKIRLEYDYAGDQEADSEGLPYIHGLADLKKALNGGEKGSGG